MEIKYNYPILIGAAVSLIVVLFYCLYRGRKKTYQKGIKAANLNLLKEDPAFQRQLYMYYALRLLFLVAVVGAIMATSVLLARPYHTKKTKEEMYARDIMLCLDVSTSVNELNIKLTKELQDTVRQLNGERVGIVIFNTSPVLLSPLTDDYDYIIEQLENINKAIKATDSALHIKLGDDWMYWNSFLFGGTLVGNEERGSSLIADGLLGALLDFPKTKEDRTQIIILATDNDPYGTTMASLLDVAELCKKKGTFVYGIGTKDMRQSDMEEMRRAVDKTGGKFYLEEDAKTFSRIVEDIQSHSANLVAGRTVIQEVEDPYQFFVGLCIGVLIMMLCVILLRRVNWFWAFRQLVVIGLIATMFVTVVIPAKANAMGDGIKRKADSNQKVIFVIDNTISMLAEDCGGGKTRLDALKEDCATIIDSLEGAKFSVLTYNNAPVLSAPFSNNADHTNNVINAIYPIETFYAKGSSLNTVREALLENLKLAKGDSDNKAAVFFISDGEITNKEALESYKGLASYIGGGAVLGYGTAAGGQMHVQGPYSDTPDLVEDYTSFPTKAAISKIDENNLKQIASDMNLKYINMTANDSGLDSVLQDIKSHMQVVVSQVQAPEQEETEGEEAGKNPFYLLTIPIFLMLFLEVLLMARKK